MSNARPAHTYTTAAPTAGLRWLSWLPTGLAIGVLIARYPALPAEVPTHFGLDGSPDGWGPKGVWLALMALLVGTQVLIDVLSRHPRVYNYPTEVTPANAQRLYREGERMMVGIEVAVGLLTLALVLSLDGAGGSPLVWVGIGLMLVVSAVGLFRLVRAGRSASV